MLHDERPKLGFHYGFIAASGEGKYASTYLHVDPCTCMITDSASYLLTCRDGEDEYVFSTTNQNRITASLNLENFCVIPINPWHQSFYGYANDISEKYRRNVEERDSVDNYDNYVVFWHEGERLNALRGLAYTVASDNFADDIIQEKIQEYRDAYGPSRTNF